MRLYELAAADPEIRFSPYCWRIRMSLAHKGLECDRVPWRFTEGDLLPQGCRTVPAMVDDATIVGDSFAIAQHLEAAYPDRPSLFGGATGLAHARLIAAWVDGAINPLIVPLVVLDIWTALAPQDREYFRTTRERRLGRTLEAAQADRDTRVVGFRTALQPARVALRAQPWLGGAGPSYADFALFGAFMWARAISRFELVEEDDALTAWLDRMLDLHGGLARGAARVAAQD